MGPRDPLVATLEVLQLLVVPIPQIGLLLLQLKFYLFEFFFGRALPLRFCSLSEFSPLLLVFRFQGR